jgi:hypothetical protein
MSAEGLLAAEQRAGEPSQTEAHPGAGKWEIENQGQEEKQVALEWVADILKHQEKECKNVLETIDKGCTTIILMLQQNNGFKD